MPTDRMAQIPSEISGINSGTKSPGLEAYNLSKLCHLLAAWLQLCDCGEHHGRHPHVQSKAEENIAAASMSPVGDTLSPGTVLACRECPSGEPLLGGRLSTGTGKP